MWVDPRSGLVIGTAGGDDHAADRPSRPKTDRTGHPGLYPVPRRVSDEEAVTLAQRYYSATGRPYGLKAYAINAGAGGNGDDLGLDFVPTYGGVAYDDAYGGYMDVDQETGRLDFLLLRNEPPPPPANLAPGVSMDDAHLVALQAAVASGVPVGDSPVPHAALVIAALDRSPDPRTAYAFTPLDRDDAVAGRGRLVYDVRLNGLRSGPIVLYTALVDASTGRLLQVRRQEFYSAGSPISSKPSASLALPPGIHAWRVAEGGAPWGAPAFAALIPASAEGFAPVRRLLLTDGRVAFPVGYDPATGRLGVDGPDGKPMVYAPGPALAAKLRAKSAPATKPTP